MYEPLRVGVVGYVDPADRDAADWVVGIALRKIAASIPGREIKVVPGPARNDPCEAFLSSIDALVRVEGHAYECREVRMAKELRIPTMEYVLPRVRKRNDLRINATRA